MLVVYEALKAF